MTAMRIVSLGGLFQVQYRVPRLLAWVIGTEWAPCVRYPYGPEAVFDTLEEAQRFKARVELRQGGGEVVG